MILVKSFNIDSYSSEFEQVVFYDEFFDALRDLVSHHAFINVSLHSGLKSESSCIDSRHITDSIKRHFKSDPMKWKLKLYQSLDNQKYDIVVESIQSIGVSKFFKIKLK